ncbi:MAG: diguanylate cyclase, partial [Mariprofundaceae bacterium]
MIYKSSLSRLLYTLFGFILVIQGTVILAIVLENQATEERRQWVVHTHEVISKSKSYLSHLIDAETGQRGFLLTREQSYLEPYYSGLILAKSEFSDLRELTSDNPAQQHKLDDIEIDMGKKFDELQQTINLQHERKYEEALAIVLGNDGKLYMDSIRKTLEQFVHTEEKLLKLRKKDLSKEKNILQLLFIIASFLLIAVTIVVAFIFKVRIVEPVVELTHEIKSKTLESSDSNSDSSDEVVKLQFAFREMHQQISDKANELSRLSLTDPLTGLGNRRSFYKRTDEIRLRSIRYKHPLSLMMLDIDLFKSVNDEHGHDVGDDVLKMVSVIIDNALREVDVLARFGGEEFAIALPETALDEAVGVAERIREDVSKLKLEVASGLVGVTISIGVTVMTGAEESIEELLKAS